jgi:4-amino-4-deoxy-L-arabinose transferase-like glycosyltransferase
MSSAPAASGTAGRLRGGLVLRERVAAVPLPFLLLAGLILARLALAAWWLGADEGVVDTESGRHLQRAWDAYAAMRAGDAWVLFGEATEYPPLLHAVGIAGAAVGGLDVESFIAAQDLVFVPALALGCYGAASVAYGRSAGVLAALFALSAPMAVSVFHMFLIDTAEAAMAALAAWAILASRRFERTGVAALAGAAVGFGLLAKQNFLVFVVGLLAVVVVRGGWRHWRGLLAFGVVAAAIAAPWYWSEVERTLDLVRGASAPTAGGDAAPAASPDRWTARNFGWYVWSTLNVSVLTPMALMTVGGGLALLARWWRRRDPADYTPELVGGGVFSYLALTWIALKDPRYALPALVYMAVLGTAWIPLLRPRLRAAAIAALCALSLLYVAGAVLDGGPAVRASLPGAPDSSLGERSFTFYSPGGWISGKPETNGAALEVLRRARAAGLHVAFDTGATQPHFNHPGLDILSRVAGVPLALPYDPANPRHAVLANHSLAPGVPRPCARTSDGVGIYLSQGRVDVSFAQRRFVCPPRRQP